MDSRSALPTNRPSLLAARSTGRASLGALSELIELLRGELGTLRPHDLRRSFARNFIRAGGSVHVAMSILGHTTLSMFTRYNVTSDDDRAEGMGKVDAFVTAPLSAPREERENR